MTIRVLHIIPGAASGASPHEWHIRHPALPPFRFTSRDAVELFADTLRGRGLAVELEWDESHFSLLPEHGEPEFRAKVEAYLRKTDR